MNPADFKPIISSSYSPILNKLTPLSQAINSNNESLALEIFKNFDKRELKELLKQDRGYLINKAHHQNMTALSLKLLRLTPSTHPQILGDSSSESDPSSNCAVSIPKSNMRHSHGSSRNKSHVKPKNVLNDLNEGNTSTEISKADKIDLVINRIRRQQG